MNTNHTQTGRIGGINKLGMKIVEKSFGIFVGTLLLSILLTNPIVLIGVMHYINRYEGQEFPVTIPRVSMDDEWVSIAVVICLGVLLIGAPIIVFFPIFIIGTLLGGITGTVLGVVLSAVLAWEYITAFDAL